MSRAFGLLVSGFALTALLITDSVLLVAQDSAVTESPITLRVSADHLDGLYKIGETAMFTIEAMKGTEPLNEGQVICTFSKDGWKPQPSQMVQIKEGKATIDGQLGEPGFLLLSVSSGKTTALAGVGFDPYSIPASMPVPEDFDQFWDRQKVALAEVPLNFSMTQVKDSPEGVAVYDVQVDCLGKPVSGYFGRPQKADAGSLPAILFVHGAGVRSANVASTGWAVREKGMLVFDINAHGIPNGQSPEFYAALTDGELKDYRSQGRDNRDQCYFRGMFLRLIRAIDFLTAQPEWDGRTVVVYGSSQGGFQAFAAAGLDPRVSFICAGVPAGCDHTGFIADRISGWPKLVPLNAELQPDEAVMQAARYFDCVNFATRAKCRGAAITVGFVDTVCPPTGIYAAYNALKVPKSIHTDVDAGHTNTPAASRFMQEAAYRHLRGEH